VAQCPADYPFKTTGLRTADPVCNSSEAPVCEPKLVIAPDCMLGSRAKTETLEPNVCKVWPGDDAVWALEPGTVGPCADGPAKSSTTRAVTFCCATAP
jgi:hypothetical protein